MARGSAGEFDSVDALNPSVIRFGKEYLNLYSGFDGKTWHTGLAVSLDGTAWTKRGAVLSPDPKTWEGDYIAANGSALEVGGQLMYWYHAGPRETPRLGLATSRDGKVWTRRPAPVVETGPRGSWDERGVADPYVIREGGRYFLFYLGQDRARRQRLGVARSRDGVVWEKLRANPVLELGGPGDFDENGLGEPAVWQEGGVYWMLYTGRDRSENRRLGFARSKNGVTWEKLARPVIAGGQAWNRTVVCDPTVLAGQQGWMVWFGGGNAPRPDEHLNGQVGFAVLQPIR
ncbi:MAG: hypothetical protein ACKV22_21410 [Bryobacteraceae bacterium]